MTGLEMIMAERRKAMQELREHGRNIFKASTEPTDEQIAHLFFLTVKVRVAGAAAVVVAQQEKESSRAH